MGDELEITTWPKQPAIFYKVSGGALKFDVKAEGNAAIGLAKFPRKKCNFWIGIGDDHRCWIMDDDKKETVTTPHIITSQEYRTFWIAWYGGFIRLGHGGEIKPIIKYPNHQVPELFYITFNVIGETNAVNWKFKVPPVLEKPRLKTLNESKPQWMPADNQLPAGALIGGYENETLYIIRARHNGSLTPGKFVPSLGLGFIPWGGESVEKSQFQVLCGFNCIWVPTRSEKIPVGAVLAGYSEDVCESLYVGRAFHNGHLIPGKIQPSHKVCYIPYGEREIAKSRYETLVVPENCKHSAHAICFPHIHLGNTNESDFDEDEYREYRHNAGYDYNAYDNYEDTSSNDSDN